MRYFSFPYARIGKIPHQFRLFPVVDFMKARIFAAELTFRELYIR